MSLIKKISADRAEPVFSAAIFLDSLPATNLPTTRTRRKSLGVSMGGRPGSRGRHFQQGTGIFSQYVIGSAEACCAALLLNRACSHASSNLAWLGNLVALGVMTGAVGSPSVYAAWHRSQ